MSYKIIVDSCGELPKSYKKDEHFESVPLTLDIDGYQIVDDETFDQADFLRRVAASPNCPKSSCPSPQRYMEAYTCEADRVYVVTLSAELSGSYNSAELGKKLYEEERGAKNIHVFNSCSASVGQTLIAMKIEEYEKAGLPFEEVVAKVDAFIAEQHTYFVLESLEALRKNGRLSNLKAFVANALNIKPVMGATSIGTICQKDQARGMNRALKRMADYVAEEVIHPEEKIVAISHCNCPERAEFMKEEIQKRIQVKDFLILDTAGVSSLYASDGGVIVAV
ncbi:DegV family protein [Anaerosacchariphilus sp. NSJ-68]|uniref:DegV family protein n=2 Tax=Lachnospiraceae TaxID=186803 RepID=A0A923LEQ5_9FIRM|nr:MULTISPECIES: DegV family protein [Lachnospiraceae]MBC5660931.1 DegV family protein [Anaerosacchariphilus hominis]MBC5699589.1 DegV family protein [Roseburia difficilis]